ncbi:permease [Corynebacterium sp. HMSC062E11]|uniref:AEC family transporter n=1 Tax=Corynebacterium TaxID=1716 RepID=UPI0008A1BF7F|nr:MULTISPECIES: AEC family transporter [unclassified Corynebacterium]MDK6806823.1 AEC family transporter [Corynebacterium aurimucosum]NJJ83379.1 AEC family transporter [Corynebacterium aurimucosum]OFK29635.1 permease [Corynebacterium sp. HMSC062E11]OFK61885.1 permease [Corynebacterium sp. HMSC078A10]OFP69973.1 permease [Corynebacterium sp. HMSC078C09]
MLDVLTGFAIIFVVIGVGFFLGHRGIIGHGEARLQFNRTAFWAATPALIFSSVATSDTSAFMSPVVAVIAIASVATMALYGLLSALFFRRSGAETMAGAAAASYYNSVNIGLPIATYVIGDATFVVPALVLQMAVLSPFIIAGLNAQGTSLRSISSSVFSGLTAPVVIAAVAGFIVSAAGWHVPEVIMAPLEILGGASIPMILMSFGASLTGDGLLASDRLPTITATVLKLVAMPAIALATGLALGLSGKELYAALILSALPTAQNVYNYAATYQSGETVARDTVFLTTFLSLPAMLAIAAFFG